MSSVSGVRFIVTEKAMGPAGPERRCFYCNQEIGAEHLSTCVLIRKKVLVRVTIEYPIWAPSDWTTEQVEFHRNESSWCASNLIDELDALYGHNAEGRESCLCGKAEYAHLADISGPYLEE